jgi:putative sigma-54 modulation protein
MEVKVIGKNVEITESLREYVSKKMGKLSRHLPTIDETRVEVHEAKSKSPDQRVKVQITIRSRGILLRTEETGANVHMAVDAVVDVLERRIERYKGKFSKKGKDTVREPQKQFVAEEVTTPQKPVFVPELVKVKHFAVKSMTVSEAADQMELLGHDFFLFISADKGALNLVYRRKDGNYGVIQPEMA